MSRPLLAVCAVAFAGVAVTVAVPVRFHARVNAAEDAAAAVLVKIGEAQRRFRNRGGHPGYATELTSLVTPCPGDVQPTVPAADITTEYSLVLRAAENASATGVDCHGHPTASDYYAAAEPPADLAGAQAYAVTSRGRVYVFFDGIAPREKDMARGGLAVPLDTLETFRIP